VLSDGTDTYLYGLDRIAAVGDTRTWHLHDALGSVRQTLDDTGTPTYASGLSFSPYGVPQSVAIPTRFGWRCWLPSATYAARRSPIPWSICSAR
jgi:hypothetical protein